MVVEIIDPKSLIPKYGYLLPDPNKPLTEAERVQIEQIELAAAKKAAEIEEIRIKMQARGGRAGY